MSEAKSKKYVMISKPPAQPRCPCPCVTSIDCLKHLDDLIVYTYRYATYGYHPDKVPIWMRHKIENLVRAGRI